jgi:hypothetical protein
MGRRADSSVGRYNSIQPNNRILIENPLAGKAKRNNSANSLQYEKYTQLLLTKCISKSQTFNNVKFYQIKQGVAP